MSKRKNFLVIVVDEMQAANLGCSGNEQVKTPNIDRIADGGVNFLRAYCNNPVCMPSRATMLTGLTPKQHGCMTNGNILPTNIPTVTKALVDHGYRTHSVGKIHLQPFGEEDLVLQSCESKQGWNSGKIKALPDTNTVHCSMPREHKHITYNCKYLVHPEQYTTSE